MFRRGAFFCFFGCLFAVIGFIETGTILNQAYAKVAKWGAAATDNNSNKEEGRSNNGQGQLFFTQSSDVKLRGGQNLKNEKVVYHYSMPAHAQTKTAGFQDRFNPPPAFQFADPDSKRNVPDSHDEHHNHNYNQSPHQGQGQGQGQAGPGPVYTPPKKVSYDSGISSYHPIPSGIPSAPPSDYKGPLQSANSAPGPDSGDYDTPPAGGYQYAPPSSVEPAIMLPTPVPGAKPNPKPASHTDPYKFPPYLFEGGSTPSPSDYEDHPPSGQGQGQDQGQIQGQTQGQDANPPPDDYPDYPDAGSDHEHHHHEHKPALGDLPEYLDHDPATGQGHDGHNGKFNNFPLWASFYDDHDHDHDHHHHYHPPTTTTTTPPPPEDENRVNKGHYSYYYLGRKLYYVPLYFSVYFIIYITVLILKSIARHKVNFVHELDKVNGRSLGLGDGVGARVDKDSALAEMSERTTRAIREFKRRYIAM